MRGMVISEVRMPRDGQRIEVALEGKTLSTLRIYLKDNGASLVETEFFGMATTLSRIDENDEKLRRQILLLKSRIERFEISAWPPSVRT